MECRDNAVPSGSDGGAGGEKEEDSPFPSPSASPLPPPPPAAAAASSGVVGGGMGGVMMMAPHLVRGVGGVMGMTTATVGGISGGEDLARMKRGRPRKYGSDGGGSGCVSLALFSSSPPITPFAPVSSSADFFSSSSATRRGRGRPPGSGRRQLLAALGEWFAYSAGGNFTPHVVTIAAGEDVATRILSFSRKGPRAICILSANGSISNVTLRQPGSSGGTLTYEGRFEILSLSGSFTISDSGGVRSRTGGISVSLAGPDGRVVGGGVAGLLLAASPIQVVVGSFLPNTLKEHKRKSINPESSAFSAIPTASVVLTAARPISQAIPDDDCETPTSTLPGRQRHGEAENSVNNNTNPNSASFLSVGWHGLQSLSEHKPSPDINICLPGE